MNTIIQISSRTKEKTYTSSTLHRIPHDFPGVTVSIHRNTGKFTVNGDTRGLTINQFQGAARNVIQQGRIDGGISL